MKRIAKWFLLLNKRLYKKAIFLTLMALIPILVLALGVTAREESGFLHISLAQSVPGDDLSDAIIRELLDDNRLIAFTYCDTPHAAAELVKTGKADAAWIFRDDLSQRLKAFSEDPRQENYLVNVVEREDNVALRLSREKLSGILYKYSGEHIYLNFIRTEMPVLDTLSDQRLLEYYNAFFRDEPLFEFPMYSSVSDASGSNYLMAPIRGLLSILAVLCALACAMFYIKDEASGTFAHIPMNRKIFVEFGCQGIAVANIGLAIVIALTVTGLSVSFLREVVVGMGYIICCCLFGMLIRRLFNNVKFFGAVIPLFTTLMIAICPIFFDFRTTKPLQLLFPPTYYVNAIYNNRYMVYMAIYCLLMILALFCLHRRKTK